MLEQILLIGPWYCGKIVKLWSSKYVTKAYHRICVGNRDCYINQLTIVVTDGVMTRELKITIISFDYLCVGEVKYGGMIAKPVYR